MFWCAERDKQRSRRVHEGCGLLWNRDKLGARNIGTQFQRLLAGQGPLKALSEEELEFHRLNVCLECV